MGRRLPPFSAVRAFEAAARRLSVKQAADELCLTPSAVSHQIRALEGYLDTRLFERSGNRLALTLTGKAYAGKLTYLLDSFLVETEAIRGEPRILRVLSTPSFAARWLAPRLSRLEFARDIRPKLRQALGMRLVDGERGHDESSRRGDLAAADVVEIAGVQDQVDTAQRIGALRAQFIERMHERWEMGIGDELIGEGAISRHRGERIERSLHSGAAPEHFADASPRQHIPPPIGR